MTLDLISKKEALEQGLDTYYTGKPCKQGHSVSRYVSSGHCVECKKINARKSSLKYYHKNKDDIIPKRLKYRQKNREVISERDKEYYQRNKAYIARKVREYYQKNRDSMILASRNRYNNNKENYIRSARERKQKIDMDTQHLPQEEQKHIQWMYQKCSEIGPDYEIDHIVPLSKGGNHEEANLEIVPKRFNRMKGNKEWGSWEQCLLQSIEGHRIKKDFSYAT